MTHPSPLHIHADPPREAEPVPVTEPRPLTTDEQLRLQALRLPFAEARRKVRGMLPDSFARESVLMGLDTAERQAVAALTDAMRNGG